MDARVSDIEKWKDEINPQRVTIKDLLLIEEKIKNIGNNVVDVKADIKEIKQMIK